MKVGLAQMDTVWEDTGENRKKTECYFEQAAERKLDMIVFPEMSLTGFSMNVEKITDDWEKQPAFFRLMSEKYGICTVCGYAAGRIQSLPQDSLKLCTNHLAIMDQGRILLDYVKIHPFSYGTESKYFQGGDRICTVEWKGIALGGFVCYDLRFPEVFQISSEDSEIIFVIANWPEQRIAHWDTLLRARAVENQCYIVGVNRTGSGGGLTYNGHSAVYAPDGERITEINEGEALLLAEIDIDKVRRFRKNFPVKNDRKKELYGKYYLCGGVI